MRRQTDRQRQDDFRRKSLGRRSQNTDHFPSVLSLSHDSLLGFGLGSAGKRQQVPVPGTGPGIHTVYPMRGGGADREGQGGMGSGCPPSPATQLCGGQAARCPLGPEQVQEQVQRDKQEVGGGRPRVVATKHQTARHHPSPAWEGTPGPLGPTERQKHPGCSWWPASGSPGSWSCWKNHVLSTLGPCPYDTVDPARGEGPGSRVPCDLAPGPQPEVPRGSPATL